MLSYNSLTYVQDMKIGHYSRFPSNHDVEKHFVMATETGEPRSCHFHPLSAQNLSPEL